MLLLGALAVPFVNCLAVLTVSRYLTAVLPTVQLQSEVESFSVTLQKMHHHPVVYHGGQNTRNGSLMNHFSLS